MCMKTGLYAVLLLSVAACFNVQARDYRGDHGYANRGYGGHQGGWNQHYYRGNRYQGNSVTIVTPINPYLVPYYGQYYGRYPDDSSIYDYDNENVNIDNPVFSTHDSNGNLIYYTTAPDGSLQYFTYDTFGNKVYVDGIH